MTERPYSYGGMLRATSIVGGATVVSLIIGLARMKALALLAGPAGIGLFGLLNAVWMTGVALAGLNLGVSGVRQISVQPLNTEERTRAESAVWYLALLTAVVGVLCLWIFERVYPGAADATSTVPWIALAVGVAIVNAAQLVFLQVYGRIADIARIRIYGALVGAIAGVGAVATLGTLGLYLAVLATPLASLLIAIPYFRRIPRPPFRRFDRSILPEWRALLSLGIGVSIAAWIGNFGQLGVRWIVTDQGDLATAGLFHAAHTLTNVNLSIVLAAMAVEYFPRLSAAAAQPREMTHIVNDQLSLAIILLSPLLVGAIAVGPWLIPLLYSDAFAPAVPLFQWQVAADVLKLASWTLGYVLIVSRSVSGFIAAEVAFDVMLVGMPWLLFGALGLDSVAIGYALGLAGSVLVSVLLCRRHGVSVSRDNAKDLLIIGMIAVGVTLVSRQAPIAGAAVGLVVSTILIARGLTRLRTSDAALAAKLDHLVGRLKGMVGR